MVAGALEAAKPKVSDQLEMTQVINELNKGRLEVMKEETRLELERLKINADDRRADREWELKHKADIRAAKAEAATKARAVRAEIRANGGRRVNHALSGGVPAEVASCEDCQAALQGRRPAHNNDMWTHNKNGHPAWLKAYTEANIPGARDASTN